MSLQDPKFSLIITVFNGKTFLNDTLISILNQDVDDWEAIIINDGSTDGTKELLDTFANKDKRLHVFHKPHVGRIKALNEAISLSKGHYVAINDDDDLSHTNRLRTQGEFLDVHPIIGMVGSFARIINENGNDNGKTISAETEDKDIRRIILRYNPFVHSSVMYRRKLLLETGGYTERFMPGFEWEIYAKIMKHAQVANIPETLVSYRSHRSSLTHRRPKWQRLFGVTRARWFVFKELGFSWKQFPFVFMGLVDLLPKSMRQ
ncbi:MAG: glycosyltransferase family A protein [bacterium]